jgi:hypothetical protein
MLQETSVPEEEGRWATGLHLGDEPGKCEAFATIEEFKPDGTWQTELITNPSAPVWAVTVALNDPVPVITLAKDNTPAVDRVFHYTILPELYVPEDVNVVITQSGGTVGVAYGAGRGDEDGELTLPAGAVTFTPGEYLGVFLELNRGRVWGAGTDNRVLLEIVGGARSLYAVKVEIVQDISGDNEPPEYEVADFARIGHWGEDTTWTVTDDGGNTHSGPFALTGYNNGIHGTPVLNGPAPENFVDKDPDRFFVRVYDRMRTGETVAVEVGTLGGGGSQDDDLTEMELERVGFGVYVSPSQLLVAPDVVGEDCVAPDDCHNDDDLAVYWPGSAMIHGDDKLNDRTHRATVDGSLVVEYDTMEEDLTADDKVPVCNRSPEERRVLKIRFHVFEEPDVDVNEDGRIATVLGTEEEAEGWVAEQLRRAQSVWAPACIRIEQVGEIEFESAPRAGVHNNPLQKGFISGDDLLSLTESLRPGAEASMIEVFFAGPFGPSVWTQADLKAWGISIVPDLNPVWGVRDKTIVFMQTPKRYAQPGQLGWVLSETAVLGHEIGHCLTNRDQDFFSLPSGQPGPPTNPPYIIYPGQAEHPVDTWNGQRRLTRQTMRRSRAVRDISDFHGLGNLLLSVPIGSGETP